ncbi:HAMP domain-containing sensor histidine kinase [Anaerocolumna sp. AGMB13025]|uniref:sensor histidine kinase n=1 Tax=Anaerocolumna sp. AGMB13025 TaxID=3039116 RepID=UPI00241F5E38|nr:HAMP domain-containing sensor histidine kinase [Anaerocolumna sp. AGMB13025]WFR55064.1 HAMP domain-containing sensor histidine kinase [Anaerocolumna sp. AGMB13025]
MNKVKGSFIMKALIHIALFLCGLNLVVGSYHILTYLDSYSANTTDFKETSEFQSKYLKYVERVAVYADYREKGYSGSLGYDSSSLDLSALFETDKEKPLYSDTNKQREDFDYYNAILNQPHSNFQYYVRNLKTGTVYCSSELNDKVAALDKKYGKKSMNAYLESAKSNDAYLIINTKTERYATNANRNYQYLNDENLSWVIDYINGNFISQLDNPDIKRGEYIICTTIVSGFPNQKDEFGFMFKEFQKLHDNYKNSIYPVPASFIVLLLFIGIVISFSGHKKGQEKIVTNSFDRCYTEVGFIFVVTGIIGLCFAAYYACRLLKWRFYLDTYYLLILAYAIIYPFCLFGFLSLIRRIKANLLFKNSLILRLLKHLQQFIRDFFAQQSITYRVFALIGLFAAIQFLAFYLYNRPILFNRRVEFLVVAIPDYCFLAYVLLKAAIDYNIITKETKEIAEGDLNHKIPVTTMQEPALTLAAYVNNIGDGLSVAVEEKLKSERLKTELIANVSHDIKTPLTSIINYVDLLKKENLANETAAGYLDVLSSKTWRLKTLIEDLMEASKASSGAISLNLEYLNLVELVRQSIGEFEDRFISHNLEAVLNMKEEPIYILADGRSTYRIIENIFSNANKYALSGTRIYVDILTEEETVTVSVKNISANKLNINSDELMERFVRGDLSRNTEGSGLGLSIAKSLAALEDAVFDIELDGDLFKAVLRFKRVYV